MRLAFRRTAIGLAAITAVLGLSAAPAHAENTYHPSDADFADCPALPAGAQADTWKCFALTAVDGVVRLNKMSANISKTWRLTIAQGKLADGSTVAKYGSFKADAVPFVSGLPGTPFVVPHPTGWQLKVDGTGLVKPGFGVPDTLGVKVTIIGDGLAATCGLGSNTSPITLKPRVSWIVPWFYDGVPMAKTQVYDDVYSLPPVSGCGSTANDLTVTTLLGVPANATSNYLQVHWALREKKY